MFLKRVCKAVALWLKYPGCGVMEIIMKCCEPQEVRSKVMQFLKKRPILAYNLRLLQESWLFGSIDEGTPPYSEVVALLDASTWPFLSLR